MDRSGTGTITPPRSPCSVSSQSVLKQQENRQHQVPAGTDLGAGDGAAGEKPSGCGVPTEPIEHNSDVDADVDSEDFALHSQPYSSAAEGRGAKAEAGGGTGTVASTKLSTTAATEICFHVKEAWNILEVISHMNVFM